jgi:hypothetical protein
MNYCCHLIHVLEFKELQLCRAISVAKEAVKHGYIVHYLDDVCGVGLDGKLELRSMGAVEEESADSGRNWV